MHQEENSYIIKNTKSTQEKQGNSLLKAAVDAMLDCLTIEQQAKMTSYLLRASRQQQELAFAGEKSGNH